MSTLPITFPPAPSPSTHSSSSDSDDPGTPYPNHDHNKKYKHLNGFATVTTRSFAPEGPGAPGFPLDPTSYKMASQYFPPTPPSLDDPASPANSAYSGMAYDRPRTDSHFTETLRNRRARRSISLLQNEHISNESTFLPPRKFTDPPPRSSSFSAPDQTEELSPNPEQLDVDLDAYSTTDYEGDEPGLDSRAPTLSFVTTSTAESAASTPPIGAIYGDIRPDLTGLKGDHEPRIRLRSKAGRASAYSSAESSMASGAYSYHSYSDNHVYLSHPPPIPAMPLAFSHDADRIGLGISADHSALAARGPGTPISPSGTSSSGLPSSPAISYQHRPWHRDVSKHMRNESASTCNTESTDSTEDEAGESTSPNAHAYGFTGYNLSEHIPWGGEARATASGSKEARALLTVEEGRERILNAARLDALGGVEGLTQEDMEAFAGVTHLLIPSIGSSILPILPRLLDILSPSLLVADLSDNDLAFLPESLRQCSSLEELNLSNNPLRQLPNWLAELHGLHVLVIDSCGLSGLPAELSHLRHLHTLCARRNKLVSLPPWLCLLSHLETLRIDENPFAAEWLPIVSPILAGPFRPIRPAFSVHDTASTSEYDPLRPDPSVHSLNSSTTSSSVAGLVSPSVASASSAWTGGSTASGYHQALQPVTEDANPRSAPLQQSSTQAESGPSNEGGNRLRKMRSAGNLLSIRSARSGSTTDELLSPTTIAPTPHSAGLATELSASTSSYAIPPSSSRFDSLGSAIGRRASSAAVHHHHDAEPSPSGLTPSTSGKAGKWGFLRKMSMNRLKGDKPSLTASASTNVKLMPPPLKHLDSEPGPARPPRPGFFTAHSAMTMPSRRPMDIEEEVSEFGLTPNKGRCDTQTMPSTVPALTPHALTAGLAKKTKRRSFLPIDPTPPSINIAIPSSSPFLGHPDFDTDAMEVLPTLLSSTTIADDTLTASSSLVDHLQAVQDVEAEARYTEGLESIKSYLRDLFDLSRPVIEPYGGFEVMTPAESSAASSIAASDPSSPASGALRGSISERRRQQSVMGDQSRCESSLSMDQPHPHDLHVDQSFASSAAASPSAASMAEPGKKFKNDRHKRARVLREIYETERTYVRALGELVNIYVRPSALPIKPGQIETVVPSSERKIVFGGVESILTIHRENLLPALEKAVIALLEGEDDEEGKLSAQTAHVVGEVFRTYIAYMKQYSTYINNFDNALSRMKSWTSSSSSGTATPGFGKTASPTIASIAGLAVSGAAGSVGMTPTNSVGPDGVPHSGGHMTSSQRKRVKHFLKRCREHPLHSQISLESYLLLPVQRVPRYKLLLEDLALCTPPQIGGPRDTLDDALNEIAGLASLMNEEKRDAESRLRLYHWQKRITSRGPSPLVQPHRKLILDGALTLIRLVKKASSFVEIDTTVLAEGDDTVMPSKAVVPVEYIKPEPMNRQMALILCTDLMVLVQPRGNDGAAAAAANGEGMVDLYNVLRMSTIREPASIVYGDVLRVVDNKSIYYFNGSSPSKILEWCRAINSARRR